MLTSAHVGVAPHTTPALSLLAPFDPWRKHHPEGCAVDSAQGPGPQGPVSHASLVGWLVHGESASYHEPHTRGFLAELVAVKSPRPPPVAVNRNGGDSFKTPMPAKKGGSKVIIAATPAFDPRLPCTPATAM